jgi:ring-1,2-phenylacetyl-CoA epoxidase subunit PaaE
LITFSIRAIRQETADTKTFELLAPAGFTYEPGQFLTIVKPTAFGEVRRQYSFSSHPGFDTHPRITVKRIPNGEVSRWLHDEVQTGDRFESIGANGFFTLPHHTTEIDTVFLLAAGSGITPLMSLMREALLHHPHVQLVLVYSNRSAASTIFLNELKELQQRHKQRLKVEFLFSDAKNLMRARLGKYVLEELFRQNVRTAARTLAYICGPLDYRQMATITLLNEGVPAHQIRKEIFFTAPATVKPLPPDQDPHQVKITHQSIAHTFVIQYPTTILQAAKEAGWNLPYSCEAGRCGTCAATCTQGEVWMSRNEVLSDREVARGRVLTCTGYPVGGDASLLFE